MREPTHRRDPGPDGPSPRDAGLPRLARNLPLDELRKFADAVLGEMAENRDVMSDEAGKPLATLRTCGQDGESTWLFYEVDMSGIGMPLDTPLIVQSYRGEDALAWTIGSTPLAETPRGGTAKETADLLEMNALLDAFRRFVLSGSAIEG